MAELEQTSAEGVSDSGLVRVTAGADGKILSAELNARVMRLDSYRLAEEFTAAANRAQEAAAAQVRDLVGEVIGEPGAGPRRPCDHEYRRRRSTGTHAGTPKGSPGC